MNKQLQKTKSRLLILFLVGSVLAVTSCKKEKDPVAMHPGMSLDRSAQITTSTLPADFPKFLADRNWKSVELQDVTGTWTSFNHLSISALSLQLRFENGKNGKIKVIHDPYSRNFFSSLTKCRYL